MIIGKDISVKVNEAFFSHGVDILAAFIVLLAFHAFCPIVFESNDDAIMLMISSGSLTGAPDEHLIFTSAFIGQVLKLFYTIWPKIEWYTLHLFIAQAVSLAVVFHCFRLVKTGKVIVILKMLVVVIIAAYFIIKIQFTTTSFLLATAGHLMLLSKLKSDNLEKVHQLIVVILIVWSSLIRFDAALGAMLVASPFYLTFLKRRIFWKIGVFSVLLIIGLKFLDINYYRLDGRWVKYLEFNKTRAKIMPMDNPKAEYIDEWDIKKAISSHSVTVNEIIFFRALFLASENINTEVLKAVEEAINQENKSQIKFLERYKAALFNYYKELLLLALLSLYITMTFKYREAAFTFIFIFIAIALVVFMGQPKNRVIFGLFFVTYILLMAKVGAEKTINKSLNKFISLALAFLFLAVFGNRFVFNLKENKSKIFSTKKNMQCFITNTNKVFIVSGIELRYCNSDPWHFSKEIGRLPLIYPTWLNGSPLFDEHLRHRYNLEVGEQLEPLLEKLSVHMDVKTFLIGGRIDELDEYLLSKSIKLKKIKKNESCELYEFVRVQ